MPRDPLGQEIVVMLALHPDLAARLGEIDTRRMDDDAKRAFLGRIRSELGIPSVHADVLDMSGG
jgi:hypothetical protein